MKVKCKRFKLLIKQIEVLILFIILVAYSTACVMKKNNKDINASGIIEATEINISTKVNGIIEKIFVDEGSIIKQGDTFVIFEHKVIEFQLKEAGAKIKIADAQLQLLIAGARDEDIKQAEEKLNQATSNLKIAEMDNKRFSELFKNNSITKKQKDDAEARYDIALSQYESAKQAYNKIKNYARPEEIRIAEAKLEQAKAAYNILVEKYNDYFIISPANGVITDKIVEQGELAGPGSILLTITQLSKVYLKIYIKENNLGKVKLNQPAEIKIDSYPGKIFEGKIIYISPFEEFTPKNVQTKEERVKLVFGIKIEIDNSEGIFKPGMPADAVIRVVE